MSFKRLIFIALIFSTMWVTAQEEKEDKEETPDNYIHIRVGSLSFDDEPLYLTTTIENHFGLSDVNLVTVDGADTAIKLSEATYFSKYFGLEGTIAWYGETEVIFTADGESNRYDASAYGASLMAVGRYPILKNLWAYAKAGISYSRIESDVQTAGAAFETKRDHNSGDLIFGAGAMYVFSKGVSVNIDYEQITIDDVDVTNTSLGLGIVF